MSDQDYRLLFETAKNAMLIATVEGKLVDINPAWIAMFGYDRQSALALDAAALFADAETLQDFQDQLQEQGFVKEFEAILKTKAHAHIVCMVTASVRKDKSGAFVGYQAIVRDITERKKYEQELESYNRLLEQTVKERTAQLETQLKQLSAVNFLTQMVASAHNTQAAFDAVAREMVHLFDVASSGITLLNNDRTELKVVAYYANRDDDAGSVVGLTFSVADNPASQQVVETGKTMVVNQPQTSYLTKGTQDILRQRQIECLVILPLLARGQAIGTIGLDIDRSGRVFSRDEVMLAEVIAAQLAGIIQNVRLFDKDLQRAYERLQELDNLKSSFIGVITHELRSPFVAADLSVQLVRRYIERGMYSELEEQVDRLDQELKEGRRMIDSIISFASLMSKQGDLFLEETDLEALAHDSTQHLAQFAEARKIRIVFDFAPNLPKVQLDQQRIGEAIHYLVHNGIKFNRDGGQVVISGRVNETKVLVKVEDTGHGVPRAKLDSIWQAFAQDAHDVQRGLEGLGLGLALVKSAVEAHGGRVQASSVPGKGSAFGFWLPRKVQA